MSKSIQMVGSESDLKSSPKDMRQTWGGKSMIQEVGGTAQLTQGVTPMGQFDKHVRGGRMQQIGSTMDLKGFAPHRGFESYDTPISDNSEGSMDRVSGYPKV
jgi:hypothetical protein